MRHLDVVDVVVSQHLFGHLGARQPAGELDFGVFAEHRLQARLHGVTGDADHDDQYVHSDHGCGVVDSLRTRIRVISRLKQGQKHVCHSLTVFSVCVVSARLLGGHQYHFINVHMGR